MALVFRRKCSIARRSLPRSQSPRVLRSPHGSPRAVETFWKRGTYMKRKSGKVIVVPATAGEDRLVGRAEASRVIGKSQSTLRRLEHADLPPVVENGVHRHSMRRLLEYKVEHLS